MTRPSIAGRWALVTGASSGLGAAFARELAREGCNLVLVARRADRLEDLAKSLESACSVQVAIEPFDLRAEDAPARLVSRLESAGRTIDILVNNAGFGLHGSFVELPWQDQQDILRLNLSAALHLTKLLIPGMQARNRGYVLHVGSTSAYQPTPSFAVYAASKAFLVNFSEALSYEMRGSGVRVMVLSPGPTRSEFFAVSGLKGNRYLHFSMMSAQQVAKDGLRALLRGRTSRVAGVLNRIQVVGVRFIPRRLAAAFAYAALRS
jgi:short-subunit dehydrogenase